MQHALHEERILFPAVRAFFPGISDSGSAEHDEQHAILPEVLRAVDFLRSPESAGKTEEIAAAVAVLRARLPGLFDLLLTHMRNEELVSECTRTGVSI